MQSQQKRIKWSRGETAEALEERTDTGITQASVELMENCIPDIFGNISRRPGLKLLENNTTFVGFPRVQTKVFPFYITENDYILIAVTAAYMYFMRIQNNVVVSSAMEWQRPIPHPWYDNSSEPISYAQQNNYMLICDACNTFKVTFTFGDNNTFTPSVELWHFNAGWYAPEGTTTGEVTQNDVPGLRINGDFTNYIYNDDSGLSTVYSQVDTGLSGYANKTLLEQQIPVGSIIKLPNKGCYFRVEGYFMQSSYLYYPDILFDSVTTTWWDQTPTISGVTCSARNGKLNYGGGQLVHYNSSGEQIANTSVAQSPIYVKCRNSSTGYMQTSWYWGGADAIFSGWSEVPAATVENTNVKMFGSLLTAVADPSGVDTSVIIEKGYTSLQPRSWNPMGSYPHPKKVIFHDQRLWAGAWAYSQTQEYAIVVGSQIARYNDLKNDYNMENEPITLDVLTQYKERILHLVDYNGLKIMTDSYEYAYVNGAVVKQSANGSFEYCEPIIFDSLCLYIDSTGQQIKAMQYEFQNNVFNSTTINQMAPHELVWYPFCMATYEDKEYNTGKYLFVINREDGDVRVGVCNFVPSNQANIWNRWRFPVFTSGQLTAPVIHSVVNLKNGVLFMVTLVTTSMVYIVPAVLDFNATADLETAVYTYNSVNYFAPWHAPDNSSYLTVPNTTVNVYSNGVFQWTDTTTSSGALTKDISQLTNVTIGLSIDSVIRSHPIDVGGKTKSIKKRIGKTVLSVHDTDNGAITINGKTGYMNPQKDKINFYGVTGMKDEIKYTLTNKNGAMFHLESLLMNIEYGTLDS